MSSNTYSVRGMTCGHCASSVTSSVQRVDGVTAVEVDVLLGRLTVTADGSVTDAAVAQAVEEAGYEVVTG